MRMKNRIVIVLCLFALSFITACQPAESLTVDEIGGGWRYESKLTHLFLNKDGTYSLHETISAENPFSFGQFQLEGTTLTFGADDESPFCAGYSVSVQAEFIEEDKLQFTLIEDDCPEGLQTESHILHRASP